MALNRENVIRAAEKYVSKGKLEAAIKEYRKVLAENPNDANTLNRVGDLYARIERFDEAVKLFSQIAEQYTRDGFFVKAIAIYKKIIKLDPTSLTVYERLAELYHKQGLLNEARTQYQVLADYYQKHDNAASAITIYQRMAELEPDNPSFHLKLAELYESQRLIDKAMKEYRLLADLLIVGGSVDEAIQVYLKALEVDTKDLEFVREAVRGLHDTGHVGGAAQILAKAVELNPDAQSLADEMAARGESDAGEGAADLEASTSFEIPADESAESFAGADSFAADDTFEIAETSFDGFQDALDETAAAAEAVAADSGSGAFTFDLDDDAVPESLVTPPPDMLEPDAGTGSGLAGGEAEAETFEIDLEEEPALEKPAVEEPEVELDWSMDELKELDVDLSSATPPPDIEIDMDLDDTMPARGTGSRPAEPMDFGLGDEELAGPTAGTEETELEPIDLEPIELEPALFEDEPADEPAGVETGDMSAPIDERREEDLLAEAKVFAKYGLQEKARDRLSELFQVRPDHLEGLDLQTRIDLEAGQHAEAVTSANLVARIAGETGEPEIWNELRGTLEQAGYTIEGDRIVGAPGTKAGDDDRIAQLLEDLSLEAFDAPVKPQSGEIPIPGKLAEMMAVEATTDDEPAAVDSTTEEPEAEEPAAEEPVAEEPVEEIVIEELLAESTAAESTAAESTAAESTAAEPAAEPTSAEEPAEVAPPAAPAREKKLVSLVDELGLDDLDDQLDSELAAVPVTAGGDDAPEVEPAPPADPLDETGMSWLDDLETEDQESAAEDETIFDEEDDFFDLAAELERELTEDEAQAGGEAAPPQEQSLEDIIEGFKQGVAENLSPEDYDTHFNLGIAYREMGLLDEAIGEFQLAAKDDRYVVDSSSLLGICFLEKGLPELAVRSYRKGLESPTISDDATLGLLYDMGTAYLTLGDSDAAYKTFVEVYGRNSSYRDVSEKVEELKAQT
ncbi:MAG: tetratricopeptide repeat protein [bacterium]|nr:tetratricopeptide repeat protein [bacterium]